MGAFIHVMWKSKADRFSTLRNTEGTQPADGLQNGQAYSFAPCSEMMGANNFARTIMRQNALPFIEKTTTEGARLFKLKSDHTSVPHSVTKLCQQLTAGAKRTRPNPHCSHKNAPGVKLDLYETHSRLRFFPPQCPEKKPGIFKNTFRVC